MKKLILFLAAMGMVLGFAVNAAAVQVETYGYYRVFGSAVNNSNFDEDTDGQDDTFAHRLRTYFDFIANENLSATLALEYDTTWGRDRKGDIGTDNPVEDIGAGVFNRSRQGTPGMDVGGNVEIKRYHLDFNWPDTNVHFRLGAQGFSLPMGPVGQQVLGTEINGAVISSPINEMVSVSFGYLRPFDGGGQIGGDDEKADAFFLTLPVKMQGYDFTPYFLYATMDPGAEDIPQSNFRSYNPQDFTDSADAFWIGAPVTVNAFDPLIFKASFIYGDLSADQDVNDRSGWYADVAVDYKMDYMTPEVFFSYWSGEDDDLSDGSETMPTLANDLYCCTPTTNIFGANSVFAFSELNYGFAQAVPHGVWQVGALLKDLTFMEDLTHKIGFNYGQGTHDSEAITDNLGIITRDEFRANANGFAKNVEFTDEDSFIEVRFDSRYQIYENLAAILELGWSSLDMDEDVHGNDFAEDDLALVNFGFDYSF
jgi:hypothetical protein